MRVTCPTKAGGKIARAAAAHAPAGRSLAAVDQKSSTLTPCGRWQGLSGFYENRTSAALFAIPLGMRQTAPFLQRIPATAHTPLALIATLPEFCYFSVAARIINSLNTGALLNVICAVSPSCCQSAKSAHRLSRQLAPSEAGSVWVCRPRYQLCSIMSRAAPSAIVQDQPSEAERGKHVGIKSAIAGRPRMS